MALKTCKELEAAIKALGSVGKRGAAEEHYIYNGNTVMLEILKERKKRALEELKSGKLVDDGDLDQWL